MVSIENRREKANHSVLNFNISQTIETFSIQFRLNGKNYNPKQFFKLQVKKYSKTELDAIFYNLLTTGKLVWVTNLHQKISSKSRKSILRY